ncbi:hypothetical protein [Polaromonas sp. CG9_12]|nr:hypothetical protein [Polaromonas sp. CG9_12]
MKDKSHCPIKPIYCCGFKANQLMMRTSFFHEEILITYSKIRYF